MREAAVTALIEKNPIDVPESLIDRQAVQMLENAKQRLAYQRLTLEMMGLDEERYKIQFRPVAESQVKGSLLLDALAKQVDIKAGDEDLENKFRQMSGDNEGAVTRWNEVLARFPGSEGEPEALYRRGVSLAALGRKGGRIGGKRRLEKMTPQRRSEIALQAAKARWDKAKKKRS